MFSCTNINISNRNALVLIPCCKQKNIFPIRGQFQPVADIQRLRSQLLQQVQITQHLADRPENRRGILNPYAQLTQATDLYVGHFYKVAGDLLRAIASGHYPSIHVLIVSAFYGLAKLNEGLKKYELQMGDRLYNGMRVYEFWQQSNLWRILQNYIVQNDITHVWSLLPNSMPCFPYHRVFNKLWTTLRNTQVHCYHVRVPEAGTGTGYKRGEWLREILRTNPSYLVGNPFPPNKFTGIANYVFQYVPC